MLTRKIWLATVLSAAFISLPAFAADEARPRTVSVSGTGEVAAEPDVAQVTLDSLSSDSYDGKLVSVETPGPDRVPAPCPYFAKCGGCALQHVSEEFYRNWKIETVKTTLERTGVKVDKWEAPVFLPAATRRRTSAAALKTSKGIVFGYNEERSHHILDIHKCLILDPALDEKMQALRPYLPRLLPELKTCDITLQYAGGAFDMKLVSTLCRA